MATGTRAGRKTRKNKDGEEPSGGEECEEENAREKGAKGMTRRSDGGSRDEKGRMEKATRRTNATKMNGNRRIPHARAQTIRRQRSGPGWLGILEPPEDGVASRLGGSGFFYRFWFLRSPPRASRDLCIHWTPHPLKTNPWTPPGVQTHQFPELRPAATTRTAPEGPLSALLPQGCPEALNDTRRPTQ